MEYLKYGLVWGVFTWLCSAVPGYFLFRRAGKKGWQSFVPVYDQYIYYSFVWKTEVFWAYLAVWAAFFWYFLIYIFLLGRGQKGTDIIYLLLALSSVMLHASFCYKMSRYFGRGIGYTVGLFFLDPVFKILLALDTKRVSVTEDGTEENRQEEPKAGREENTKAGRSRMKRRVAVALSCPLIFILVTGEVIKEISEFKSETVEINAENFLDTTAREELLAQSCGEDSLLTKEERESIKEMTFEDSLEGVQYFPKLTELDFGNHYGWYSLPDPAPTAKLDTSMLPELKILRSTEGNLLSLDVSENPDLEELYCYRNNLESLDVSRNKKLKILQSSSNPIGSLDVSNNPELEVMNCNMNGLDTLDVSKNPELKELHVNLNNLKSLDVSGNPELDNLWCDKNYLDSLDLSANSELTELFCRENGLDSLDVSKNPGLEALYCSYNNLTVLDLSKNPELRVLDCYGNKLRSLDVSGKRNLSALRVGGNPELTELDCSGGALTFLSLGSCPKLKSLYAGEQQVTVEVSYSEEEGMYVSDARVMDPDAVVEGEGFLYSTWDERFFLEELEGQTAEFSVQIYDDALLEEGSGLLSGTIRFIEKQ